MSTISLPYEDQIRHFYLGTAFATETNITAFASGATIGEIQIFGENGTTADTSGKFYIAKKNQKGGVSTSPLIDPKKIEFLRGTAPVAKTGKTQTFTLGAAPTVGKFYTMSLKINYGNSEENFITFVATEKAVTGDTQTTLLVKLAEQIGKNLAFSVNTNTTVAGTDTINGGTTVKKNKYFTLSVAGSVLTIAEKDWILEDFKVGLRSYDQLLWNAEVYSPDETENANITKGGTAPVFPKGQGYQIIELERYLVGHRAEFDYLDRTLEFDRAYETDINSEYYVLDLKYYDISRDSAKHSDKMLIFVSEDELVTDALGYAIEARMGGAEGDLWTELDPNQDGSDNE